MDLEDKKIAGFHSDQRKDLVDDLINLINSGPFKSTLRIAIIVLLGINGPLTFTDLQRSLRTGKGSLKNHLDVLEMDGFVEIKNIITLKGPRLIYRITGKGKEFYEKYIRLFSNFK
ncbi:transcriptional regulator [Thermoplasma sp.]|uniref:transcriptional regulator n=1 Tax=Thermoplasma sp. TaxID=1973142 RepID=UPI00127FF868|nr:MAG: ArsR family transcriptional regulator [Thermoplasma sp.]